MISDELLALCADAARKACKAAYCPYSKFPVGAAVLAEDGRIFSGCNVENASYGMTMCAERSAVFQAIANGLKRVIAVIIYTPTAEPTAPCGGCRQVIYEFGRDAEIVSLCESSEVRRWLLSTLLADAFELGNFIPQTAQDKGA